MHVPHARCVVLSRSIAAVFAGLGLIVALSLAADVAVPILIPRAFAGPPDEAPADDSRAEQRARGRRATIRRGSHRS